MVISAMVGDKSRGIDLDVDSRRAQAYELGQEGAALAGSLGQLETVQP